jgi:2-oxo-4-hydroxy-4-carboxy-5-ureidoimidazoline decarboxylase
MDALSRLNDQPASEARLALARCCGAARWVEAMTDRRPYANPEALFTAADEVWWGLDEADWREAFAHHPKIGDRAALGERFSATRAWAAGEQAGAALAEGGVLDRLAEGNRAYEARFGYIFIVCATGKTAEEMLALLEARLPKDPREEIRIAAAEQARITRLRLEKLLLA